ncbi:protein Wnt-5b isoform X2 [Bemisia tabaci]|uniref:protein Wnt-5b isoform X2 n=1 Tax=Bemisia tabaci TaxID=7038 RepID=UPI003B28A1FC
MTSYASSLFFWRFVFATAVLICLFKDVEVQSQNAAAELALMQQFEQFMVEHEKVYDSLAEKMRRFEIFKDNLKKIEELNADPEQTAIFGVNVMADLTKLVDCTKESDMCEGGEFEAAFKVMQDPGLTSEKEYPYKAANGTCKSKFTVIEKLKSYKDVSGSDSKLIAALPTSPLVIAMNANDDFQWYIGGVLNPKSCPADGLNHGVVIIGLCGDSWLIRNSWGTKWGTEKGHPVLDWAPLVRRNDGRDATRPGPRFRFGTRPRRSADINLTSRSRIHSGTMVAVPAGALLLLLLLCHQAAASINANSSLVYTNLLSTAETPQLYLLEDTPECGKLTGLTPGQAKLCELYRDHMPGVGRGAKAGLAECQHQFKNRRWNCSSLQQPGFLGIRVGIGSREAAFMHAINSAGVSHSISRACKDGQLSSCGCSSKSRPKELQNDWVWGGCGDNLEYGFKFTQTFFDLKEKEKKMKKSSREYARSLMDLHNNEAGRRAIMKKSRITCKCHGVSGSCSMVTCWHQMPTFREVGDFIKEKYDGAAEVKLNKKGRLQMRDNRFSLPTASDLIYIDQSPNYCIRNLTFDSLGTQGRICNRTSIGMDGCKLMCCDRGYNTKKMIVKERCDCKFQWCCFVECKTCTRVTEIHTCK